MRRGATDEGNFVKKAVSWSLQNRGKRSAPLRRIVRSAVREMRQMGAKAERWTALEVIRELEGRRISPGRNCDTHPTPQKTTTRNG
jgi:3-methyladenine DNA glycosylase AlkD